MNPSHSHKKILDHLQTLQTLTETFLESDPLFPGSLYELKTRCGKPECKCAQTDYRHRAWCVSFVEQGASRTRVVADSFRPEMTKMTDEYRRFRQAERQLRQALEDLLGEVEALREERSKSGRRHFERLASLKRSRGRKTVPRKLPKTFPSPKKEGS